MVKYSIIIPTRNRRHSAPYAIQSAIECIGRSKEIIVVDNSDNSQLYDILDSNGFLQHIKYVRAQSVLSMSDNWELGLSASCGEYVAFMGDDDAITPYALCAMDEYLAKVDVDAVHCKTPTYNWPDILMPGKRNLLYVLRDLSAATLVSRPRSLLEDVFSFDWFMGTGPGVYHGFVRRSVIERTRLEFGRYFFHESPDLSSGFATLLYASKLLRGNYPLFIDGHCKSSNSGSLRVYASYLNAIEDFKSESGSLNVLDEHYPRHNTAYIVQEYLRLLPKIEELTSVKYQVNFVRAFERIADSIFSAHENVHILEIKNSLKQLANKWGIAGQVELPKSFRLSMGKSHELGFVAAPLPDGTQSEKSVYDLSSLGIKDVYQATKFLQTLLPIPLDTAAGDKSTFSNSYVSSQLHLISEARDLASKEMYKDAIFKYEKYLEYFANDYKVLNELGQICLDMGDFERSIICFARSFSLKKEKPIFEKYIFALVGNEQSIVAENLLQSYVNHCVSEDEKEYFLSLSRFLNR